MIVKYKKWIAGFMICSSQIVLFSCAKDVGNIEKKLSADKNKLTIRVNGIDNQEIVTVGKKANVKDNSTKSIVVQNLTGEAFDAVAQVVSDRYENKVLANHRSSAIATNQGMKAAAMVDGIKYRLLLYKMDGSFQSSTLLSAGTDGQVVVDRGASYKWYAVSYNSTEEIADFDHQSPKIAFTGTEDILFAKGEVSIPNNDDDALVALGIIFKHSLSRIGVEINSMGMFADMTDIAIDIAGSYFKVGKLNLLSGEIEDKAAHTFSFTGNDLQNVALPYQDRKMIYVHTIGDQTGDIEVKIKQLTISLDDQSQRSFNTILSTNPFVFLFPNVATVAGESKKINMNLVESPLTTGDGTKWARTNLYYLDGHNAYRFSHHNLPSKNPNSFWSIRGYYPNRYGYEQEDPCLKVYPEGVWRKPLSTELDYLTRSGGSLGKGTVIFEGQSVHYIDYAATGLEAPYPNAQMRIYLNGTMKNLNGDQENPDGTVSKGYTGNFGTYGVLQGMGDFTQENFSSARLYRAEYNGNAYNISSSTHGKGTATTNGKAQLEPFWNIRCVRN